MKKLIILTNLLLTGCLTTEVYEKIKEQRLTPKECSLMCGRNKVKSFDNTHEICTCIRRR